LQIIDNYIDEDKLPDNDEEDDSKTSDEDEEDLFSDGEVDNEEDIKIMVCVDITHTSNIFVEVFVLCCIRSLKSYPKGKIS